MINQPEADSLWRGLLSGICLNVIICLAAIGIRTGAGTLLFGLMNFLLFAVVLYVGLVQVAWLLPFYFMHRSRGASETANGVAIAAGITFVVWAGYLFLSPSSP